MLAGDAKTQSAMADRSRQRGFVRHIVAHHDGAAPLEGGEGHQRINRGTLGQVPWHHLNDATARAKDEVIRTASDDAFQRGLDLWFDRRRQPVVDGD